jgi:tRNA-Thr(GGU) m(6)t(6)A37 methyltransferase TsaA
VTQERVDALEGLLLTRTEAAAQARTELVSEVIVFCTLALLGGGLFVLLALTDLNWYYPTVFYGVAVYIAWLRYY